MSPVFVRLHFQGVFFYFEGSLPHLYQFLIMGSDYLYENLPQSDMPQYGLTGLSYAGPGFE